MPFIDTRDLETREPLPGWEGRYFHSEHMTFGYYTVIAGSSIHEHSHEQEEVWHVIEGKLEVTVDGETLVAGPGCVALVPPDTTHSVRVLEDSRAIVVDTPLRDFVGGARTD
jgi:quercetin dioxygenase-like cupin family protein